MSEMLDIGGRMFRPFTANAPRQSPTLRGQIESKYGSLSEAARQWGITRAAVHHYVTGRRTVPQWVRENVGACD